MHKRYISANVRKKKQNNDMGEVTELRLFCYLVLLSIDSKTT